jgi:hypothetical protein
VTTTLHITNGDSARNIMEQAGIVGDILPWRDVLHEGPVPAGLSLDEMSAVRAQYIIDCGWADERSVLEDFQSRDARLKRSHEYDDVVLWFEHDLYDQLQLLQLLNWFATHPQAETRLSLICADDYLGTMKPARLGTLLGRRKPVTERQLALGREAWTALCAPEPRQWASLRSDDTGQLPFLAAAIVRHLEQFPALDGGLNRTETQLLAAVGAGIDRPGAIFEANQEADGVRFMGDASFWQYLSDMVTSDPPLLRMADGGAFNPPGRYPWPEEFRAQKVTITPEGREVLERRRDWLAIKPPDHWLGGVHLQPGNVWRWDGQSESILRTES